MLNTELKSMNSILTYESYGPPRPDPRLEDSERSRRDIMLSPEKQRGPPLLRKIFSKFDWLFRGEVPINPVFHSLSGQQFCSHICICPRM